MISSMSAKPFSNVSFPYVNRMRRAAAVPDDVDSPYIVKVLMIQIDGIQLTPYVAFAFYPVKVCAHHFILLFVAWRVGWHFVELH